MAMYVGARWIPRSKRGRAVARILRAAGYSVRDRDVCGRYASNLPCWSELSADVRQRLAYALDPEAAMSYERNAIELVESMTDADRDRYERDLQNWAR